MAKKITGGAICIISVTAALVIYVFAKNLSQNLTVFQYLSFCGVYYPVMLGLDVLLTAHVILKSHVIKSLDGDERDISSFERAILSKYTEAAIFVLYTIINLLFAWQMYLIYDTEFYSALLCIKGLFFSAIYIMQCVSAFFEKKTVARAICLIGIAILAAIIYFALNAFVRRHYPMYDGVNDYLNIVLMAFMAKIGRTWEQSYHWIPVTLIVSAECILPTLRLIGLALYNTKYNKRS